MFVIGRLPENYLFFGWCNGVVIHASWCIWKLIANYFSYGDSLFWSDLINWKEIVVCWNLILKNEIRMKLDCPTYATTRILHLNSLVMLFDLIIFNHFVFNLIYNFFDFFTFNALIWKCIIEQSIYLQSNSNRPPPIKAFHPIDQTIPLRSRIQSKI